MPVNLLKTSVMTVCAISLLSACTTPSAIKIERNNLELPSNWLAQIQSSPNETNLKNQDWLQQVITLDVKSLIDMALEKNFTLQQQAYALEETKQRLIANGANFWPSLDFGLNTGHRHSSITDTGADSSGLNISASYELDVWGKLSAQEQQLNLTYQSQKIQFELQKTTLIKNVVLAWYQLTESQLQFELAEKRLANVKQNLAVIEAGYESGLNSALDVYLSRTELATEQSSLANQSSVLKQRTTALELLIGHYPKGGLRNTSNTIPKLNNLLALALPSEVITKNAQLQSEWNNLLASDAGLAYSHKQRFPSLSFTASTGYSSEGLGDLLSNSLGWSLFANISSPIFNAGKLKANEQAARLKVKQAEQGYLNMLFNVLSSVENGITENQNLQIRLSASEQAAKSATLAEQISFEQYTKGLTNYTTVLNAQSRAFNAQSSLINLKYQQLVNQLQLFVDLGGDFQSYLSNTKQSTNALSGEQ